MISCRPIADNGLETGPTPTSVSLTKRSVFLIRTTILNIIDPIDVGIKPANRQLTRPHARVDLALESLPVLSGSLTN